MKHTPGPWHVANTGNHVLTKSGSLIAEVAPQRAQVEANTRLIAEAPATLEALRKLLGAAEHASLGHSKLERECIKTRTLLATIDAEVAQ